MIRSRHHKLRSSYVRRVVSSMVEQLEQRMLLSATDAIIVTQPWATSTDPAHVTTSADTTNSTTVTIRTGQPLFVSAVGSGKTTMPQTFSVPGTDPLNAKYAWDFGDNGSEYDQLPGFNASHVYDAPGTYHVQLTLTEGSQVYISAPLQVDVTQWDPSHVIYVDADNGSDSNNNYGASEATAYKTLSAALDTLYLTDQSNTAIFLKGGTTNSYSLGTTRIELSQTYDATAHPTLHDITIRSWDPSQKAVLDGSQLTQSWIDDTADGTGEEDYMFEDLSFVGGSTWKTIIQMAGQNIAFRDCTFENIQGVVSGAPMSDTASGLLLEDCSVPVDGTMGDAFAFLSGTDIAILGNFVNGSYGENIIRLQYDETPQSTGATRVLIYGNELYNGNQGEGKVDITAQVGAFVYVSSNQLWDDYEEGYSSLQFGPLAIDDNVHSLNKNPSSIEQAERIQWCVGEDNHLYNTAIEIGPGSQDIMLRNNTIDRSVTGQCFDIHQSDPNYKRATIDIRILNNTGTETDTGGMFLNVDPVTNYDFADLPAPNGELYLGSTVTAGITLVNNIYVNPSMAPPNGYDVEVESPDLNSFNLVSNNVWQPRADGDDFEINGVGKTITQWKAYLLLPSGNPNDSENNAMFRDGAWTGGTPSAQGILIDAGNTNPTYNDSSGRIWTPDNYYNGGSATQFGQVTGATDASTIVITTESTFGLKNGDTVRIEGVGGNTNANGVFHAESVSSTTFSIYDPQTGNPIAGNGSFTSGSGDWANLSSPGVPLGQVSGASNTTPIVVTVPSTLGLSNGDTVSIEGVEGNTNANGVFYIEGVTGTAFSLYDRTSQHNAVRGNGSYTGGGGWASLSYYSSYAGNVTSAKSSYYYQDQGLFYSYREGTNNTSFSYAVQVANGTYALSLYFLEPIASQPVGARVFNVTAQGNTILSNFDIVNAAGGAQQDDVQEQVVSVTNGILNLGFNAISAKGNPLISGIAINPISSSTAISTLVNTGITNYTVRGASYPNGTYYPGVPVTNYDLYGNPRLTPTVSVGAVQLPPQAPTGLSDTQTNGQVKLTWNSNPAGNVVGYLVYRNSDTTPLNSVFIPATTPMYTDAAPPSGTVTYNVIAVDDGYNESAAASIQVVTSQPPVAASGLVAAPLSDSAIRLAWVDNSGGQDPFNIMRSSDGTNFTSIGTAPVGAQTYDDNSVGVATTEYYEVVATSGGIDASASNSSSATTWQSPTSTPVRIYSSPGDTLFIDSQGNAWHPDWYGSGGSISYSPFPVAGAPAADAQLYYTQRQGNSSSPDLTYAIPAANGTYSMRLLFAEPDSAMAAGGRVFNVTAENTTVLNNFDIVADIGAAQTADIKEVRVTVTGGELDLQFTHDVGYPVISAIELDPAPLLTSVDIGTTTVGSTSVVTDGVAYNVTGNGQVNGFVDSLHFAYETLTGDFDFATQVSSLTNANAYTVAALMARADLAPGSANVTIGARASASDGFRFNARPTDNADTDAGYQISTLADYPYTWLRLTRVDNTFTAYYSVGQQPNGIVWTMVGQETVSLPQTVYFGLAASSYTSGLATATFDDFTATPTPAAATNLTASPEDELKIHLAWTDNSNNETGFKIMRSSDGGSTYSLLTTVPRNTQSYDDDSVGNGQHYYYQVIATNTYSDATSSNTADAWVIATPVLSSVVEEDSNGQAHFTLNWGEHDGDGNYVSYPNDGSFGYQSTDVMHIYWSADNGATWNLYYYDSSDPVAAQPGTAFIYDPGITQLGNTQLVFKIQAENAEGQLSQMSNEFWPNT